MFKHGLLDISPGLNHSFIPSLRDILSLIRYHNLVYVFIKRKWTVFLTMYKSIDPHVYNFINTSSLLLLYDEVIDHELYWTIYYYSEANLVKVMLITDGN